MKNKSHRIITIVLVIIGFIGGFYGARNINKKVIPLVVIEKNTPIEIKLITDDQMPIPNTTTIPDKIEKTIYCPKPTKIYEDETYANVNQNIPLRDMSYVPADLVALDSVMTTNDICLKKEASLALSKMIEAAQDENKYIKVTSGFRSFETQDLILKRNLKEKNTTISTSVAKPGYSEHQLGTTVDLTSRAIANASASSQFANTPEYMWLKKNAYQYGFVESYPKDKESTTGYIYEPWHYRYVGIDNAKNINESGKTVTEFFIN